MQPGQKVLVNGASGGVGTFAVQIAKALGAEVTAVCSTQNVDAARALGADRVVDYTQEDFTRGDGRYDLLLDIAGSRSWRELKRVLEPDATLVLIGGPKDNRLLGPLGHVVGVRLASLRSSRKVVFFIAQMNKEDMVVLQELLEAGKVKPVVERSYPLSEAAEALRYLGEGHAQAKIAVSDVKAIYAAGRPAAEPGRRSPRSPLPTPGAGARRPAGSWPPAIGPRRSASGRAS